ncbi:hypothetical protein N9L53_03190 [Schleiferiaceae bacterium]|nr:hypothetical protein [Schleiferiaceae bacterium]
MPVEDGSSMVLVKSSSARVDWTYDADSFYINTLCKVNNRIYCIDFGRNLICIDEIGGNVDTVAYVPNIGLVSKLTKISDTAILALTTDGFHIFYLNKHDLSLKNHEHIDFIEVIMGFSRNDSISAILATDNIANSKVYLIHNSTGVISETISLNYVAQNIKLSESYVYVQTHSGLFRCSSDFEQLNFLTQYGVLDFDILHDSVLVGVTNDKMVIYDMNRQRLIQERVTELSGYCCPKLIRCNNQEIGLLVENRINTIEVSSGRVTKEFNALKVFSKMPGVTYVMQEDSTLVKYDCSY